LANLKESVSVSGKSERVVVVYGVGMDGGLLTQGGADVGAIDGGLRDSMGIEFLAEQ
jgi:hypothetical protein